jgi:hypothetical protein
LADGTLRLEKSTLKLDRERCAIVIVGAWNPAIFTPEWMTRVVFGAGTLRTQIALGPIVSTLFSQDRIAVTISPGQLQVSPELGDDEPFHDTFVRAERGALKILARLPETPIRAFGINLGFIVEEASASLDAVLQPSDVVALKAARVEVESTIVVRRLLVDRRIVNLSVSSGETPTGRPIRVDFNYHFDAPATAATDIPGGLIGAWRTCVRLCDALYGIKAVEP